MATFTCKAHPQLVLRRGNRRVRFQDGSLEAHGEMADAVRQVADRYGIVETTPEEPKSEPKPRRARVKRDEIGTAG